MRATATVLCAVLLAGCYQSSGDDAAGPGATAGDPSSDAPDAPPNEGRYVGNSGCRTDWVLLVEDWPVEFRASGWKAESGRLHGDLGWVLDLDTEQVTVTNGLPNFHESGEEISLLARGSSREWSVALGVILFGGAAHPDFAAGTSATYAVDAPPEPGDGRAFVTAIGEAGTADKRYFFLAADAVDVVVTEGASPGSRRFDLDARFTAPQASGCPEPGERLQASFDIAPQAE